MKIVTYLAVALIATGILSSCKKGDDVSAEDKQKAEDFKANISAKQFRLVNYWSDKAIDYDEEDGEIKQETDLWPYVSNWIKDDLNVFDLNTNKVTITQNTHKYANIADETFTRDFSVGADKNGAYLNFVNYQYEPLQYRIVEFNANEFTVYVDWHSGAKVFSKFQVVQ
ncbi:MAG: hypothetical protein JNK79_07460 [Chitinophagaceae bacterium]|nr:hypothetical protein [Chitinophagaceae bacterium]